MLNSKLCILTNEKEKKESQHFDSIYSTCKPKKVSSHQIYHEKLGWFSSGPFSERGHLYAKAFELLGILSDYGPKACLNGKVLLDYGCGHGALSVFFAELGAKVVGIDISKESIKLSKEFADCNRIEKRCNFIQQSASDMHLLSDSTFDIIFCDATLHHTIKYPNSIKELYRVLKPGGIIITLDPLGTNIFLEIPRAFLRLVLYRGQGEYTLKRHDLINIKKYFELKIHYYSILFMAKRLFRGEVSNRKSSQIVLKTLWHFDNWIISKFPFLSFLSGECVLEMRKPTT